MSEPIEAHESLLGDLIQFAREEQKWILAPLILMLLGISTVLVFLQGSSLAPFIYPFF